LIEKENARKKVAGTPGHRGTSIKTPSTPVSRLVEKDKKDSQDMKDKKDFMGNFWLM